MIYPYRCKACEHEFTAIKSVKEINRVETCPECSAECDESCRYISRTSFYGADDWNKEEYCPALGKVIKNRKHRAAEAKRQGLIEIGNEKPDNIHKHNEQTLRDIQQRRWDQINTDLGEVRT